MTSQARSSISLQVLLHDEPVGLLTNRGTPARSSGKGSPLAAPSQGWLQFSYAPEWLERTDAVPLSLHLPLQDKPFDHWASHAFFAGLLPTGALRQALVNQLHIAPDDDLALLEALGADCLGAVSLRKAQSGRKRYAMDLVSSILPAASAAPQLPLFEEGQAESGQGQAAEQALLHACGELILGREPAHRAAWPAGNTVVPIWQEDEAGTASELSSHVLWMAPGGQDAALLQRAFTLKLLQKLGVPVLPGQLMQSESITTLLQLRPDRQLGEDGLVTRVQTETLGQALGLAPGAATSRQAAGWAASFAVLREHAHPSVLPVLQLLDMVIAFALVGDATASPHRLLLQRAQTSGNWQLAPLWDVCSTLVASAPHLPEPSRMALSIGRHSSTGAPSDAAWDEFAQQCGLSPNQVRKRVRTLAQAMRTALPQVLEDETHAQAWQHPAVSQLALHLRARADQMARSAG